MKNYIKQYNDFLNESTIETTWITPKDLVSYLDENIDPYTPNLHKWIKEMGLSNLNIIIDGIFSKSEKIQVCLKIIKDVKISDIGSLYDMMKRVDNPTPLAAIDACDAYLKGEIGDNELDEASNNAEYFANFTLSNRNSLLANSAHYAANANILKTAICANNLTLDVSTTRIPFEKIFIKELENFDWSRVEKEIRGHDIFGE